MADTSTQLGKPEIEKIVRDYLLANPEILREMQTALEAKEKEEQRVAHLQVIQDAKADIFTAAYDGVVGNPERQDDDRRVLRLQLRLLQTRQRRHDRADRRPIRICASS